MAMNRCGSGLSKTTFRDDDETFLVPVSGHRVSFVKIENLWIFKIKGTMKFLLKYQLHRVSAYQVVEIS